MERDEWENGGLTQPSAQQEPEQQEQPKLTALQAENRRLQTQVFAYERAMLALQRENAELEQTCGQLQARIDRLNVQLAAQAAMPQRAAGPQTQDVQKAQEQLDSLSAQLLQKLDSLRS